jgi:hypothetical protein
MMGPGRSLPPPADGWLAAQFLHRAKDTVVSGQAWKMLQEEPLKGGRSRGDNERASNAAMA